MSARKRVAPPPAPPVLDGGTIISTALEKTWAIVKAKQALAGTKKKFKKDLSFAITFALQMSELIAAALRPHFPEIKYGETPSRAVAGLKRVDVSYNTNQAGLGLAVSLKSVHFGERDEGASGFIHNMKRNDEELRVEATGHHLRQPYAVLVGVLFLPLESCTDQTETSETSSFASWVQYLWPLKGRDEPEDPPDRCELVFVALYSPAARNAAESIDDPRLGFYHVGGRVKCPRRGIPELLTFEEFLKLIKKTYDERNGKDFAFEGEGPAE